ncbi:MAG: CHRD domain-containing protein [Gammaproteobacteria bacterium]|nr:CHRD domain-containing protein [Gammaproteobacteria bacterium]
MKKLTLLGAMVLAVSAWSTMPASAGDGSVTLIHTGDLHGHMVPRPNVRSDSSGYPEGGLAHMYTKIKSIRDTAAKNKIPTLLINTGDTLQGSAETMFTQGQAIIDVLNLFKIDAHAPGNWDYVYGKTRFNQVFVGDPVNGVAPLAPWNALAANLYDSTTPEVAGAVCPSTVGKRILPPFRIVTAGNVKVGILGMTTERGIPAIGLKATAGFTFTSGQAELPCFITYLRNTAGVDLLVMISELELGKTIKMTETYPGVDVVLNADMHEETAKAIVNSVGTLLVEEGQDGTALGELALKIVGKKIYSYKWTQHVINTQIAPDLTVVAKVAMARKPFLSGPGYVPNQVVTIGGNTAKLLRPINTVVGTAGINLHRSNFSTENLPAAVEGSSHDLMADAFRWAAGSDLATVRGFRYGTHVPAGKPIRMEDLYHYMPIAARIAKAGPVDTWQIKDQVENSTRSVFDPNAQNWRGGWMFAYSGLTFDLDASQKWGCRGSNIKLNGVPISPSATEPGANLSTAVVNGDMQVPPVVTTATGTISAATYDKASKTFTMKVTVTGIPAANITGMHIHLGACGVSGPIIVALPSSGWVAGTGNISMTVTGTMPAANEVDLLNGNTYLNIHTTTNPTGQLRGQINATTQKQLTVAGYWYADDPGTINNCGACAAGVITPLVDASGNALDTTEIVVNYLASLPNNYANPVLNRIKLLKPLPTSPYGFPVIQPLQGVQ